MTALALTFASLFAPPADHEARRIAGWTVQVDRRLLAGPDAELGLQAIGYLEARLQTIALTAPADKLPALRRTPIWFDRSSGQLTTARYHPSAAWLADHGYDRRMAKAVHIPSVRHFLNPRTIRAQPCVLLTREVWGPR